MGTRKMMKNGITVLLAGLVLVSNIVGSASRAQRASAEDCSSLALTTADCLSFVTSGSIVQKPEGSCCYGLKKTLMTDAECLCEAFKNSAQLGITLNVTKALTLPAACHVFAPSFSDCGLNVNPNVVPAVSPTASSPSSSGAARKLLLHGLLEAQVLPPLVMFLLDRMCWECCLYIFPFRFEYFLFLLFLRLKERKGMMYMMFTFTNFTNADTITALLL